MKLTKVNTKDLKLISNQELISIHRRTHQLFSLDKNKIQIKFLVKVHDLISKEMIKRKINHISPLMEKIMTQIEQYLLFLNEKDNDHWIQHAIKKPGSLHKALHVSPDKKIPIDKLKVKDVDTPLMKKRKLLAKNLKNIQKK